MCFFITCIYLNQQECKSFLDRLSKKMYKPPTLPYTQVEYDQPRAYTKHKENSISSLQIPSRFHHASKSIFIPDVAIVIKIFLQQTILPENISYQRSL